MAWRFVTFSKNMFSMPWLERDKEKDRFYLLPGMGGKALRRKRRMMLWWAIGFGLFVSAVLALLLFLMSGHSSAHLG